MRKIVLLLSIVVSPILFSACNPFVKNNMAGLQVITGEVPASIFLDGQYLDKSPFIGKEIKPGTYSLSIQPDDPELVPYETTVNLTKGLLTVVTWQPGARPELSGGVIYELEKLNSKKQTELSIVSIPDGAIITIDGGLKEFAPYLSTTISAGTHEIEITLPSYNGQRHTINVVEGHRLNVLVKLAKSDEQSQSSTTPQTIDEATAATSSATPVLSSSPLPTVTQPLITGPKVTIESTNFFQGGKEVLRVRDAAGSDGKEIGFAEVGNEYRYLGEKDNGWYKIDFENQTGWVSGTYTTLQE